MREWMWRSRSQVIGVSTRTSAKQRLVGLGQPLPPRPLAEVQVDDAFLVDKDRLFGIDVFGLDVAGNVIAVRASC